MLENGVVIAHMEGSVDPDSARSVPPTLLSRSSSHTPTSLVVWPLEELLNQPLVLPLCAEELAVIQALRRLVQAGAGHRQRKGGCDLDSRHRVA